MGTWRRIMYGDSVRQNISKYGIDGKDWRRKSLNKCTQQETEKEMNWTHPGRRLTIKGKKTDF